MSFRTTLNFMLLSPIPFFCLDMPLINNLDRFNNNKHFCNYCFVILRANYGINDLPDTGVREWLEYIYYMSLNSKVIAKCKNLDLFIPACYLIHIFSKYGGNYRTPLDLIVKVKFYCEILYDSLDINCDYKLELLRLPKRNDVENFSIIYDLVGNIERHISKDAIKAMRGNKGIYKLYDKNKRLIYIGRSINLIDRVVSSAKERKANYFSIIVCKSEADMFILEPYLISKLNPPLNCEFKTKDKPSFIIKPPKQTKLFSFKKIKYAKH